MSPVARLRSMPSWWVWNHRLDAGMNIRDMLLARGVRL
jgi:hypothetical protein